MKPRIDVFISSTSIDLPEHRAAVRQAIESLGLFPSGMETWPLADESPVELCQRMIADAEIYVGIYAHRYGWCRPGFDGKGITELEYDWATERGIPRFCFIMHEDHPWASSKMEHDAKPKLDAFKGRVKERVAGFFTTPDNLARQVITALATLPDVKRLLNPEIQCNTVPPPDRFVGRTDELTALNHALTDARAIAITAVRGIGGIGKSTLAKAFAQQDTRFPFKLWAELGQVASEDLLPRILRSWIGADFPPDWSAQQMIAESRRQLTAREDKCGEPVLLLLDDVWSETVPTARQLRDAAPLGAHVLITTRSEDAAAALDATSTELNILPPDQGAALIIDLIGEQAESLRADFESLSTTLGGHPLALALAARQLRRNFNPAAARRVIAQLKRGVASGEDFKDLHLDAGDAKVDSVSATLRLTLDSLSDERQQQFRALGALPLDLPFRAWHAMFVCGIAGENEDDGYKMLADFAAEGLIKPDPERADWYTQHRLLRAYARALLRQHGELDAAEQRHWNYLIRLADKGFDQPPETWRELDDDLPQIHALGNDLAARLADSDDPTEQDERLHAMSEPANEDVGARYIVPLQDTALLGACENYAAAVYGYVFDRYIGAEGRRWLWAGLTAARASENQSRVGLFTSELGVWHNRRGDEQAALAYHEQTLAASRAQSDKCGEAIILSNIGNVWSNLGDHQQALDFLQQALPLFREVGDKGGEAATLNNIGGAWDDLGDHRQALDFFQQALPLFREVGNKGGEAVTLNNIGLAWDGLGDHRQALDFYQQALPLHREVGNQGGEAETLVNIGAVSYALGNHQQALDFYQQALPVFQKIGDPYREAVTRFNIAMGLWNRGQQAEALEHMQIARDLNARIGISTEDEDQALAFMRGQMGSSD